jgi:hypothetical protein
MILLDSVSVLIITTANREIPACYYKVVHPVLFLVAPVFLGKRQKYIDNHYFRPESG